MEDESVHAILRTRARQEYLFKVFEKGRGDPNVPLVDKLLDNLKPGRYRDYDQLPAIAVIEMCVRYSCVGRRVFIERGLIDVLQDLVPELHDGEWHSGFTNLYRNTCASILVHDESEPHFMKVFELYETTIQRKSYTLSGLEYIAEIGSASIRMRICQSSAILGAIIANISGDKATENETEHTIKLLSDLAGQDIGIWNILSSSSILLEEAQRVASRAETRSLNAAIAVFLDKLRNEHPQGRTVT